MADAEYKRLGCKAEGCDKDSRGLGLCATHYRRLKRHGSHDPANKICANCGVGFATVMHNAMYCSKVCKVQAWRAANPEKALEAAKRSAEVQAKRKPAPRKLRGSLDDRAPESDHILPVSVGGEHSYRNTQCACRACNAANSNKPMGQMLLIG